MSIDVGRTQKELEGKLEQLRRETTLLETSCRDSFVELQRKGVKLDLTQLEGFVKSYWRITPTKNPNEWEVAIPVIFSSFNVGHWDRTDGGYNIYVLDRYTQWFGEKIPDFIRTEVNIPKALEITYDGITVKFPEDKKEIVEKKFGSHLSLIEKDHAVIKQGQEFDLIAEIIEQGSLPFIPRPVAEEDLMESDFTTIFDELQNKDFPLKMFEGKHSYQGDAWNLFLKYGSTGIFWAMSFGKTVIGTYVFSRIKGAKALIVPSVVLKDQWTKFFQRNCPRLLREVEIHTYQGMSRKTWQELSKKQYKVVVFDECHFLPATSFSKLATVKTKYRIGLSASPFREDGRTNYIMALTGYPQGLDWRTVMQKLGKEYHTVNVHVVKDLEAKYSLAKQLFNPEERTLFFVYRLDVGSKLAAMFNIPFYSGESGSHLDEVLKNHSFVASKRYEHGVSIKDLEHIIEVDFQFGGRQEEMQRSGRLLHSESKDKKHDIIMTKEELESYGKRIFALQEKGFRPRLITHLSGVASFDAKPRKSSTVTSKDHGIVLNELFDEGYFQIDRSFSAIKNELRRRGVAIGNRSVIFKRLCSMVKSKKLFKTKTKDGYTFISRNQK